MFEVHPSETLDPVSLISVQVKLIKQDNKIIVNIFFFSHSEILVAKATKNNSIHTL